MARLRRAVLPGQPHMIIHRGQSVFLDAADHDRYLAGLRASSTEARVAIHAYALLENEVRLLATPSTATGLADLMQAVGRQYVPAFNKKYGRSGSPWQGRFRSTVIEAETHFRACLRFVEARGEVRTTDAARALGAVDWSSAAHHLGTRADPLISDHPAFWAFGNTPFEREAAYRQFVKQTPAADEVATILLATLNGWVLGSPEFAAAVGRQTGRRPQPAQRGRPRKGPAVPCADDMSPNS
jgi:putative transposase